MSVPAQISAQVNLRHNVRTSIQVEEEALGFARLEVGTPDVRFSIFVADGHLDDLIRDLRRIQDRARRKQASRAAKLEAVAS